MINFVTPCVGVWIETVNPFSLEVRDEKSHPAWVCGLKQNSINRLRS